MAPRIFMPSSRYFSRRGGIVDPSGFYIPAGLLRIGTGRDEGEIPFAAIFGKAESEWPVIEIHAVTDKSLGLAMPVFTARLSLAGRRIIGSTWTHGGCADAAASE